MYITYILFLSSLPSAFCLGSYKLFGVTTGNPGNVTCIVRNVDFLYLPIILHVCVYIYIHTQTHIHILICICNVYVYAQIHMFMYVYTHMYISCVCSLEIHFFPTFPLFLSPLRQVDLHISLNIDISYNRYKYQSRET